MQILPITDISQAAATLPTPWKGAMAGVNFAQNAQKNALLNKILGIQAQSAPALTNAQLQNLQLQNMLNTLRAKYFPQLFSAQAQSLGAGAAQKITTTNLMRRALGLPDLPIKQNIVETGEDGGADFGDDNEDYSNANLPMTSTQVNRLKDIFGNSNQQPQSIDDTVQGAPVQTSPAPTSATVQTTQPPLQDSLRQISDVMAALKGNPTYSMQEQLAGVKAKSDVQAKDMDALLNNYSTQAEKAADTNDAINEFEKAYSAATMRGPIFGRGAALDPAAQVALKEAATMLKDNLYQFKGLGQIRVAEIKALAQSQPDIKLSPAAVKDICNLLRINNSMTVAKNRLAQNYQQYTDNPSELQSAVAYVRNTLPLIYSDGSLHPEDISLWDDYRNPEAFSAIKGGNDYIPESLVNKLSPQNLDNMTRSQKLMLRGMLSQ